MDPIEIISQLQGKHGFYEVWHQSQFMCYRNAKDGSILEVAVSILDRGPEHGKTRYRVVAKTPDGKAAHSNSEPSVELAIELTNWQDLG